MFYAIKLPASSTAFDLALVTGHSTFDGKTPAKLDSCSRGACRTQFRGMSGAAL